MVAPLGMICTRILGAWYESATSPVDLHPPLRTLYRRATRSYRTTLSAGDAVV